MPEPTTKRTAAQIVGAVADAAHDLFVARSPSAVSMRDIAAASQVNLGMIHRYIGSKQDVIALVLARHTEQARLAAAAAADDDELLAIVADAVVNRPGTGRLIAGMILDGVDVKERKGEFPLLERLAESDTELTAAFTYALALGWEVFGPSLSAALGVSAESAEVSAGLVDAMRQIQPSPTLEASAPETRERIGIATTPQQTAPHVDRQERPTP